MAEPAAPGKRSDYTELIATVFLALAAVATAWSSFQASRWNGEQALASSRTNAIRLEAGRAQGLSEAQSEVDVATFIQWVDARAADDAELEGFYVERFRDEFRPAFEAWLATHPFENNDAPPTPFAMPEYRLKAEDEAARLDQAAEASSAVVRRNVDRATNYVLCVVLFAVTLFCAGLSTKLKAERMRYLLLGVGGLVFVATLIRVATFPVSLEV